MRRISFSLIIVLFAGTGVFAIWATAGRSAFGARPVPRGDQEIAWIHAATSVSAWERFVTGVNRVARGWPEFHIDDSGAFPEASTATPQLIVSLDGHLGRIYIRWYKLSKDATAADWMTRLAHRTPPPLAVIGGGSSDRAYDLAKALASIPSWAGEGPVYFITTATASTIVDPEQPGVIELMNVYPGRSFRMSFTNEQMARAVVDFVWSRPDLRPHGDPILTSGAQIAQNHPLAVAAAIAAGAEAATPSVWALEWDDDPYSVDLSQQFHRVFHERATLRVREKWSIPFSVGGQYSPNAWEQQAADKLSVGLAGSPRERQLLVLPTGAVPARRVLRSVTLSVPNIGGELVAITGDAINLNNVYRDADIGWNVRALPVPLVFFAQQNPVGWDWPAADEDPSWMSVGNEKTTAYAEPSADQLAPPTSTDETLLHRDMIRLIASAAFGGATVTQSAEVLRKRLMELEPPYFASNGDRLGGRGEFVTVLRPVPPESTGGEVRASLEVWTRVGSEWKPVKRLLFYYGRHNRAG